jgi:AmmeMemoRadiSam system protein B
MSLVFAAITPHPPLLIPTIGKDALKKLEKTKQALGKLEEELYLSKPELIIIISPHAKLLSDAFTLNVCSEFTTDLSEFGDLSTHLKFKGEMNLASKISEGAKKENFAVALLSNPSLDHGSSVPLFYLTPHLNNIDLLPIGFCDLDFKTHAEFGYFIKDQIMKSNKRIAVIASGDLSHALTTDAPAGFNPAGKIFDEKIQALLSSHNTAGLLQIDSDIVTNSATCGFKSFLILMGILRGINFQYKSYCYEPPFGIGHLTAQFSF